MTTVTVQQQVKQRVTVTQPIGVTVSVRPTGPKGDQGIQGPPGDTASSLWEADTETTIKPIEAKTVDAAYISGELYGGLFQP